MPDIQCVKCGEPWERSGIRETMTPDDADRFLRKEGCPCCRFGTACRLCDGTGRETTALAGCPTCRGRSYVLAWQPRNNTNDGFRSDTLYYGYSPFVRKLDTVILGDARQNPVDAAITLGVRAFPERFDSFESKDGWVDQWWIVCPDGCAGRPAVVTCTECGGTGQPRKRRSDNAVAAMELEELEEYDPSLHGKELP